MTVVDVDWASKDDPAFSKCTLRLIYDSDFDALCDADQDIQVFSDWGHIIACETKVCNKITKHHVPSKCVAFHGIDSNDDLMFLRFGYYNSGEEELIPRSMTLSEYMGERKQDEPV